MSKLTDRLRGHYRIAITDGLGPAGGEEPNNADEFVRTFTVPPIQKQAADIIDELAVALAKLTDICERQPRFYKLIPDKDSPLGLARTALSKLESLSNE